MNGSRDLVNKSEEISDEEKFRMLSESVPTIVFIADDDGKILHLNSRWFEFTGHDSSDLRSISWVDSIHPDDLSEVGQTWALAKSSRTKWNCEYRLRRFDGIYRWHLGISVPKMDIQGQVQSWMGTITDIHERKVSHFVTEASEKKLDQIFSEAPSTLAVLVGPDFVYEKANKKFYEFTGYNSSIIGKSVRDVYKGKNLPEFLGLFKQVYETGIGYSAKEVAVSIDNDKNSRTVYVDINYQPLRDMNGKVYGLVSQTFDVTEKVQARKELEQAKLALEEKSAGLTFQKNVLEVALSGKDQSEVLLFLTQTVEMQLGREAIASILLVDASGEHLLTGAAAGLPHEFNEAINGIKIGPLVGSCGTAAFNKKPEIVYEIETSPLWKNHKDLALKFGLKSCWSFPILSSSGSLLGTFAIYAKVVRSASESEIKVVEIAAKTAALILERQSLNIKRIESEERLNLALTAGNIGFWDWNAKTGHTELSPTLMKDWGIDSSKFGATLDECLLMIHKDDRDRVWNEINQSTFDKKPYDIEYRVVKPNGEMIWVNAKGRIFLGGNGLPERLTGITLNITDRKGFEGRLKDLNSELEGRILERTKQLQETFHFADLILENIPNMIFVKDAKDLKFLRFNKAGEELLGLSREALLGKNDYDFFPADQARHFQEKDKEVLAGKVTLDIPEETIETAHSGKKLLHTKKIPILDQDGQPKYLVGISEDITEKKQLENDRIQLIEARIERQESIRAGERLSFLADASAEMASSLELETILKTLTRVAVPALGDWCTVQIVQANGKLQQLAVEHKDPLKVKWAWELQEKYPPPEDSNQGHYKVFNSGKSEMMAYIPQALLMASAQDEEHRKIIDSIGFYSYICAPIKVRQKIIGTFTVVTTDESKRRFDQADLKLVEELCARAGVAVDNSKLFLEAKNLNKVKDEFLATLSHELRTPINIIQGHADILKTDYAQLTEEELQASISAIQRNTRLQTQIVSDLLDVSSIITGKVSYVPQKISPKEIMGAVSTAIQSTANAKNIIIFIDLSKAPEVMMADPTRLHQILWNLVNNAVKFTPPGGKIEVSVEQNDFNCVFTVKDNGIGIGEEFLPFVFDRFRQADSSSSRTYGGLGLGLAIVKSLAEIHGGSVTVASEGLGKGSSFTVSLPIKTSYSRSQPVTSSQNVLEASPTDMHSETPLKGVKILLVEDSPDNRELVRRFLVKSGATILSAESAVEARGILQTETPDIILSDIGMPEENGLEFIKRLRGQKKWSNVPAVALTAYVRPEEISEALSAGFHAHISKPINAKSLVSEIVNVLKLH